MTPTFTHTFTLTPTLTFSPTNSPMGTRSPVLTPTHTRTATITLSPTPSPTKTATVTPTFTATPGVFKFAVSSKPDERGEIHLAWGTNVPASEAYLRVYTSGFRLVWEENFNKEKNADYLTAGTHQTTWNAKDDQDRPMPPGTYLCFISVTVGKKSYDGSGKTEIP